MLIASPNLCLDITIRLPRLVPGTVARATATDTSAGGKGVNVARAARAMGTAAVLAGFLPTRDGARFVGLLEPEKIELLSVDVPGVLRVATILLEDDGRVSMINGRGPEIDSEQWHLFTKVIGQSVAGTGVLVCSGSLPPGVPDDAYGQLVEIAHRAGAAVVVDAAPTVLKEALPFEPDLVSPNLSEAEGLLFGTADELVQDEGADMAERAVRAAVALHAAGAVRAVVTAGSTGAALCSANGVWWLAAPAIGLVNPIGAGDCFAAGAALALAAGAGDVDIVRNGMAVASASCETPTAGRLDPRRAAALLPSVNATPVDAAAAVR